MSDPRNARDSLRMSGDETVSLAPVFPPGVGLNREGCDDGVDCGCGTEHDDFLPDSSPCPLTVELVPLFPPSLGLNREACDDGVDCGCGSEHDSGDMGCDGD